MKKLSWLSILLILTGCSNLLEENVSMEVNEEYFATIETSDSRTYLDEQVRLRWTAEDCISVFSKTTDNREYVFTGVTGARTGGFRQKSDESLSGVDVPYNYAVYPYSSTTTLDNSDLSFNLTLPSEQTYVENSFGLGENTMVAVSENNEFKFKNIGSFIRVRLYGENTSVSSITLTSKGEEAIAGTAKVTAVMDGDPTCELTGTGKSIRLVCSNLVAISSNAESPTDFWIVVPPVTLQNGFSVSVEESNGNTRVFDIDRSLTFERNKYYDLKRDLSTAIPYVTFTANNYQELMISKVVSTLQYSVNNGKWKDFDENTEYVSFGGEDGSLRLRGKSLTGTATGKDIDKSAIISFYKKDVEVSCQGDIRTLVDYEAYETVETNQARFCNLFYECQNLASAPKLPATDLADYCYYNMFQGCSKLTTAPELPAENLKGHCYERMFYGCSNLINAPELPASSLADYCYASMFANCKSLTVAPTLEATNLADYCYQYMFDCCFKLTTVQTSLPATSLTTGCYQGMFGNCSVLATVPELPATTLAAKCYQAMFQNCKVLKTAPTLPAPTLADYCYMYMFNGCSSLTTAPELPAKVLTTSCYSYMFYNCTSLSNVVMLATNINASYCLDNWLYNVGSWGCSITISADIDHNLFPKGSSGIPTGWTVYKSTK